MPSIIDQYVSTSSPVPKGSRLQLLVWAGTVAFLLVWMGMIVAAPVALSNGYDNLANFIYTGFSPLCHQISERSFQVVGYAFAVCSRCTGIYAGFAAGVIVYPLVRSVRRTDTPGRIWLLLAVVPIAVDWAVGLAGFWTNTHLSRFLTGAFLGSVCAFFVVPGLMDLLEIDWRRFMSKTETNPARDQSTVLPIPHERSAPSDYSSPSNRI